MIKCGKVFRVILVVIIATISNLNAWCNNQNYLSYREPTLFQSAYNELKKGNANKADLLLDNYFNMGLEGHDLGYYYLVKGLTKSKLTQKDSVYFFLDKSLEIFKDTDIGVYSMPLDMIIEYYLSVGDIKKANDVFSAVDVSVFKNSTNYRNVQYVRNILFNMGIVKYRMHDWDIAATFMWQYMEILNNEQWLLNNEREVDKRNQLLSLLARFDDKAIASLTPQNKMIVHLSKGYNAFEDKDYKVATKQFEKVIRIAKDNKCYDYIFFISIDLLEVCYAKAFNKKKNAHEVFLKVKDQDIEVLESKLRARMFYEKGYYYFKQKKLNNALYYWQKVIDIAYMEDDSFDVQVDVQTIFSFLGSVEDEKLTTLSDDGQFLVLMSKAIENNKSTDIKTKRKGLNYLFQAFAVYLQPQVSNLGLKSIYVFFSEILLEHSDELDEYYTQNPQSSEAQLILLTYAKFLLETGGKDCNSLRKSVDNIVTVFNYCENNKNEFVKDSWLNVVSLLESVDPNVLKMLGNEHLRRVYIMLALKYGENRDKESLVRCVSYYQQAIFCCSLSSYANEDYYFISNSLNSIEDSDIIKLPPDKQMTVFVAKGILAAESKSPKELEDRVSYLQQALNLYVQGVYGSYVDIDKTNMSYAAYPVPMKMLSMLSDKQQRDVLYMKALYCNNKNVSKHEEARSYLNDAINISDKNIFYDNVLVVLLLELYNCCHEPGDIPSHIIDALKIKLLNNLISVDNSLKRKLFYILALLKTKDVPKNNENAINQDALSLFQEVIDISACSTDYYDDILVESISNIYSSDEFKFRSLEETIASVAEASPVPVRPKLRYFNSCIIFPRDTFAAIQQLEKAKNEYIEENEVRDHYYINICYLLSYLLEASGRNDEALSCMKQMITECEDLFDYYPQDALDAYILLRDLFIKDGNTQIADMIYYKKNLLYCIKSSHNILPGKTLKQIDYEYNEIISSYHGGQDENDLDIICKSGEYLKTLGLNNDAGTCYKDCIRKAKLLNLPQYISLAHEKRIEIAIASRNDSLYTTAYQEALEYANKVDNKDFNVGVLDFKVGFYYFIYGDDNRDSLKIAYEKLNSANNYFMKHHNCDAIIQIQIKLYMATIKLFLGDNNAKDKIMAVKEEIEMLSEHGDIDSENKDILLFNYYFDLGKYYINKDIDEAIKNFDESLKYADGKLLGDVLLLKLKAYKHSDKSEYVEDKNRLAKTIRSYYSTYWGIVPDEIETQIEQIESR